MSFMDRTDEELLAEIVQGLVHGSFTIREWEDGRTTVQFRREVEIPTPDHHAALKRVMDQEIATRNRIMRECASYLG